MDTIIDTHRELKGQLFLEVLKSFGQAKLAVTGASMLPAIWPGDVLEVRRQDATEICLGEVILFERDGRLFAHRVVEKVGGPERTLLITQGDGLRAPDPPVAPEELLGRVTAIVRGGRRIDPQFTRWRRVASWVLSRSHICTSLALRLRRRTYDVCIDIGMIPILVHTESAEFAHLLEERYGSFVVRPGPSADLASAGAGSCHEGHRDSSVGTTSSFESRVSSFQFPASSFQLEVELVPPGIVSDAEEVRVRAEGGRWVMERGDFRAEWDLERRRGRVRQSPNPYSIDSVLRILHSLVLAREGGFLVHAASAIRNGRAFLFAGVSGAGKTTISRLAPPDVALLTDEISYVREVRSQKSGVRSQNHEDLVDATLSSTTRIHPLTPDTRNLTPALATSSLTPDTRNPTPALATSSLTPDTRNLAPAFEAFGTPFTGELASLGENRRAPVAALYLLAQGEGHRVEAVSQAEAARALLQNILFFAHDEELVRLVSESAFDFVSRVPVRRLIFAPDTRVWELIA